MKSLFLKIGTIVCLAVIFSLTVKTVEAAELRIIHAPVQSGDCALIIFPNGKTMLIDTGKEDKFTDVVEPFLLRHCVTHLDYFVNSHPHGDHVEGQIVMEASGMIDGATIIWDWKTFDYEDEFTIEDVNFFIYNTRDTDFHGTDANENSLAFRMEYNGFVYQTGGDEGLASMNRFRADHPELVPAHVRKIAHHMWGPLSVPFLRDVDAYLYVTTNSVNIVGYGGKYDDWDDKFIPDVIEWSYANGGRMDDLGYGQGYVLTGVDGFVSIWANDSSDWGYTSDTYNNRFAYNEPDWTNCQALNADFESQSAPANMLINETVSVDVTMTNTGSETWTAPDIMLGSQNAEDNTIWGLNRVSLSGDVDPGEDITFTFDITAPATEGTYEFQWQMTDDGVEFFGEMSENISIIVTETLPMPNQATIISPADGGINVLIDSDLMWNAGTYADSHEVLFGTDPGNLISTTQSGTSYDPGTMAYSTTYYWQINETNATGTTNGELWSFTTEPDFDVFDAEFISQSVPSSLAPGEEVIVTVTMKNTGNTSWSEAVSIKLFAENPNANTNWVDNPRIKFTGGQSVAPGETWDFVFELTAPLVEDTYNFQWRMLQEGGGVGKFGDFTDNVSIEVSDIYTGIKENSNPNSISVLGNQIVVKGNGSLNIFNFSGGLVHQSEMRGTDSVSLRSGNYLVRLVSKGHTTKR